MANQNGMTPSRGTAPSHRRMESLAYAPVIGALLVLWTVAIGFSIVQRTTAINDTRSQLSATLSTLADLNELTQQLKSQNLPSAMTQRTTAIWRALLQYPTAAIWVTSKGQIEAGRPPSGNRGPYIFVDEKRASFTVHAAVPERDALSTWRNDVTWDGSILAAITLALLVLTQLLARALRLRRQASEEAALAQDRARQLTAFQDELQKTIAERTQELRTANTNLESELQERLAAETALRKHDALLNAVTKSAAELHGSHGYEDAIATVLELIGQTVGVGRVQLNVITIDKDGHMRASVTSEWTAPGSIPTIDNPAFQNIDFTTQFATAAAPALSGHPHAFFLSDIGSDVREQYRAVGMQSFLQIPIMPEGKLWGVLTFVDSSDERRKWSWAETDGLQTMTGLIAVAIIRARYVKQLADANMIVQNSPTILYRLRGEPSLPLAYISPNITKFGHDPAKLLASDNWSEILIDPEDQAKFGAAMTKALRKDSVSGSIEFRLRGGDETLRWVEDRYTPVRDKLGRLVEVEGIIIDITERKIAEEKIALLARTDGLTGLANRTTFIDRLRQSYASTQRGAAPFAVLCLDVDHFKDVNDTLGHPVGDLLIKELGARLKTNTRSSDVVARLGGDEFAILQTESDDPARAGELAGKLLSTLSAPYQLDGNNVNVTVSIGIAPYAASTTGADMVLAQADLALYRAKEQGRNQYRFHTDDLDLQVRERVSLSTDLRHALETDQLELYYQPQVEVLSGEIVGVEALLRWRHPTRGLLAPKDFFSIAEQTGAIMTLGHWVLERACRQMRRWQDEKVAPKMITINLSLLQLKNARDLVKDVVTVLQECKLDASVLEFDVTEATLAQLTWTRNDVLRQLHELGVKIAIDDFGTEYSSFDYLKSYNVSHLKIARSLIAKAMTDSDRAEMVRVMITLARELGIGVMAEGVETEEQRKLLISTGSPAQAQGYYFSKPVEAEKASELLRQRTINPKDSPPAERETAAGPKPEEYSK